MGSLFGVVEDSEVIRPQFGPFFGWDPFDEDIGPVGPQPLLHPSLLLHESLYGLPKLHEGTTRTFGGASRTLWYKEKCAKQCLLRGGKAAIPVYVAKLQRFTRVTPEENLSFLQRERSCLSVTTGITRTNTSQLKAKHRKLAPFRKSPHRC